MANAFIQSNSQCIHGVHFISSLGNQHIALELLTLQEHWIEWVSAVKDQIYILFEPMDAAVLSLNTSSTSLWRIVFHLPSLFSISRVS